MKLSNSFFYTIRDDIKDEDSKSGNLLVRSGMIKKEASGVYMFMPMGLRVKRKIENIIREEMDKAGANEILMPALIPSDIFHKSHRYESFGPDMFKLKDRNEREFCLGPTHEELFVMAAKEKIKSYKDMPFNIYQIQDKFRDEARPRFGLIRTREFTMKDAYSFDTDEITGDISYQKMVEAYKKSFDRMGIDYRIVRADTGVMGGDLSEEFQAVTSVGEDVLVMCDKCDFASNIEVAPVKAREFAKEEYKEFWKKYKDISKIKETNYLDYSTEKQILFLKKDLKELEEKISKEAWQNAKNDFNYPIFMAEAEAVGITSTGETGENIPNELIDKVQINEATNEKIIIEKGIATHFKEFLQKYQIQWV